MSPASATPPNIPDASTAQAELDALEVAEEGSMSGYSRDLFPQPLGLPFDQWFVYDNGGPLPFVPYVAFGDIAFLATNFVEDSTIKDSFIILTVFF